MILYVFFHDLIHIHSAGTGGHTSPRGHNLDVNRKALSLYPFIASFKEISLKYDFIHFFHDLIYIYIYIAQRQGAYSSQGTKF